MKFLHPSINIVFRCHNPKGVKLLTRLRPGLSHLSCYVKPSCSTILFLFVYSASVVFMLYYLTTTPSLLCSQSKVHSIHFIYHIQSDSFHLPWFILFFLLIIVHHFQIYHVWSYSCYIVIETYFHNILGNTILLKYIYS